ncbi:MAG: hypothetical protein ABEJ40_00340 [Haloarculaceae archaeon]
MTRALHLFGSIHVDRPSVVRSELDLPTYGVDPQYDLLCSHGGAEFVAANWVGLLGAVALSPRAAAVSLGALAAGVAAVSGAARVSETAASLLAVPATIAWVALLALGSLSWPVAGGLLAFAAVAWRTADRRNEAILERIAAVSDRDGVENGVLVVGKAHLPDLRDRADESLAVGAVWARRFCRRGQRRAGPAGDAAE